MNLMNRVAYTIFIAFLASVATLGVVWALSPEPALHPETEGRVITLDEVNRHSSVESCWKAIDGVVYDITAYIPNHPTSPDVVARYCGDEATGGWDGSDGGHSHSSSAAQLLQRYQIGVLPGHEDKLREADASESAAATPEPPVLPRATDSGTRPTGRLTDGSYYEELEPDGRGWIAVLEMTVHDGQIVAAHYDEIQRDEDGAVTTSKRADYNYQQRWRNAVPSGVSALTAFPGYAEVLKRTGDSARIDAFTGATSAHDSFTELAEELLSEAQQPGAGIE